MKVRQGFVSNSSSSSFVINKSDLTEEQIEKIHDHSIEAGDDAWSITEDRDTISGSTFMDNFGMVDYLENLSIAPELITWDD